MPSRVRPGGHAGRQRPLSILSSTMMVSLSLKYQTLIPMPHLWTTNVGSRSVWCREVREARLIRQGRIRASGRCNLILNEFHDSTEGYSLTRTGGARLRNP